MDLWEAKIQARLKYLAHNMCKKDRFVYVDLKKKRTKHVYRVKKMQ